MEDQENKNQNLNLKRIPVLGYFFEKSFFHYVWTGGFFTILNIFLVWLFIDVLGISTIVSSTVVIGGLFILRYIVYKLLKVM
jgi:putative flippase GtrA